MSNFVEYKPMDVEHNVKAAVENLRKAYWSNDTEKVAKIFTEAEGIIVSAICHDNYTVCKTDAEQPKGDLISREALKATLQYKSECIDCSNECCTSCFYDIIDNAPTIKFSLLPADESKEEAYKRGYENGKAEALLRGRPKGEWILIKNSDGVLKCYECSECKKCQGYISNFCEDCGADMRK